jgi:hypothetical protein
MLYVAFGLKALDAFSISLYKWRTSFCIYVVCSLSLKIGNRLRFNAGPFSDVVWGAALRIFIYNAILGLFPKLDGKPTLLWFINTSKEEVVEVSPDSFSFLLGSIIMLAGVVIPLGFMILKNKKVFTKQKS